MTDTPDIAALVAVLRTGTGQKRREAADALEKLARERDHYLSNWQEARQYLAIETQHAEQAEAERDALAAELEQATKLFAINASLTDERDALAAKLEQAEKLAETSKGYPTNVSLAIRALRSTGEKTND